MTFCEKRKVITYSHTTAEVTTRVPSGEKEKQYTKQEDSKKGERTMNKHK